MDRCAAVSSIDVDLENGGSSGSIFDHLPRNAQRPPKAAISTCSSSRQRDGQVNRTARWAHGWGTLCPMRGAAGTRASVGRLPAAALKRAAKRAF